MHYTQHPLSAAFPAMQDDEYQALKDSIEVIGVQNAITLYDGMVLDGWHRYSAANDLGMDCPTVELGDVDPVDFVRAQNKHRRHSTPSALALAEVSICKWAPSGRLPSSGHQVSTSNNAQMAERVGVHVNTIKQAKVVEESATDKVKDAVKSGAISVKTAAAVAKLPAKEQNKIAAKGPEAMRAAAKPAPSEQKLDDLALTDADLIEEMQETQAENKQLLERVELMSSDNKAAEIDKLLTRISGLEGRINQLMMQVKTSADGEKYHATVIHKLRKLLGVEGHKEIIAAVTELVADRRLAA